MHRSAAQALAERAGLEVRGELPREMPSEQAFAESAVERSDRVGRIAPARLRALQGAAGVVGGRQGTDSGVHQLEDLTVDGAVALRKRRDGQKGARHAVVHEGRE